VRSKFYSLTALKLRTLVIFGCSLLLISALLFVPTVAVAATSINLAWDPNSDSNLAGYNIYRSTQSGVFNSPALNGTALLPTTTFSDSSVQGGQTYYYVVKAVSTDGTESSPSNQVQVAINSTSSVDTTAPTVTITIVPLP
jgi:fibronectin type 3 domain-containing protein